MPGWKQFQEQTQSSLKCIKQIILHRSLTLAGSGSVQHNCLQKSKVQLSQISAVLLIFPCIGTDFTHC